MAIPAATTPEYNPSLRTTRQKGAGTRRNTRLQSVRRTLLSFRDRQAGNRCHGTSGFQLKSIDSVGGQVCWRTIGFHMKKKTLEKRLDLYFRKHIDPSWRKKSERIYLMGGHLRGLLYLGWKNRVRYPIPPIPVPISYP